MKRILIIIATLFVTVGASAQIQKNFFGLGLGYISQAEKTPHRNGQRFTDYTFPLKGDVEQIEILEFFINPDNGKEYPTDTTIIKFNKNGDVTYIWPYVNTRYTDIVHPTELRFLYNNLGYNTLIREIVDTGFSEFSDVIYETHYTYNADWQKIRGEKYNDEGQSLHTEEFIYDSQGRLATEKYVKGSELVIYTYDDDMNVIEIEEYHEGRLYSKTNRTYNAEGKILQEIVHHSNRFNEMEKSVTTTYLYDDNGFLYSRESKSPIPEMFLKYYKDSRTETTDTWIYKCDSYGNVIEKISYDTDSSRPNYRTEYRISYR